MDELLCIEVVGKSYEQCFTVGIEAGVTASIETSVSGKQAAVTVSKGTAPYQVLVNGTMRLETTSPLFTVDVQHGDLLEVMTAVDCEGIYAKSIELFDAVVVYPNPTQGLFEIAIPSADREVPVQLFNIQGQLISSGIYPVVYGKIQLNLENKPSGLYIAKVQLDKPVTLKIIKE